MSTIVGTNVEVTNLKYDSDTTSMIISNTGQVTIQGENTATTNLQQGLSKAWARFNGTGTAAIDDSYNISTITDNTTGDYNLNYTNNMNNDNYAKVDGGGHWSEQSTADATSSARMRTYSSNPALADYTNVTFVTIGDLA